MKLSSLNLNQFRCFENLRIDFPEGIVIFHGNNAEGKTSILEAICVLLRLQSPRTSNLAECARFQTDSFAIGGRIEGVEDSSLLKIQFRDGIRKFIVDGEIQKRSNDYLRHSGLVVWMANDDLALIRGGGEGRRKYLDFMGTQLFADYRSALKDYEKALRSRNFLLKRDASPKWAQIDAYTKILHYQGQIITRRRRDLVQALDPLASTSQFEISGRHAEDLQLTYQSASGENDDLQSELDLRRDEEFKKRSTAAGPHRDDFAINLNGRPAAKFGSEGQQRTVALALKIAQAHLFIQKRREPPVLLIDDVFGELDPARRNCLMATWPPHSQKIITTTHLNWLDEKFDSATRLLVRDGRVER